MEDIDGGLHRAVDGQCRDEDEDEDEDEGLYLRLFFQISKKLRGVLFSFGN